MVVFYKVVASKITLREFAFETKLFCWVGLIVQLFKLPIRGSTDDLAVDSIDGFRVDPARLPPDRLSRFDDTLSELAALGFEPPLWYDAEDVQQATRNTFAVGRHSSGRAFARVQCRTNFGRVPPKTKFFTTFVSAVPGGYVVTGNGKYDMAWPASQDTLRFRHLSAGEVWAKHQDRMSAAVQTISEFELPSAAAAYHESLRDFHLARGVFQPLSEAETKAAVPVTAAAATGAPPPLPGEAPSATRDLPEPDLMERATLDELEKLQNKAVNWPSFIALLLLSGGLFVLHSKSTDGQQDWQQVAVIVGVLLFHELGHYVAMKLFGYRNLRMFFIPGFGAAVSGRHYNAPAWKKTIVSLAGPLPGIVVGTGLMLAYVISRNELLFQIGLMALILNAINLIPILPLDGGRVAHATVFVRHPKLDVGFRLVAALTLIGLSVVLPGMRFLMYIAFASLVTLPLVSKLASIVNELRRVPDLGISPDSQTIPPDTARIILAKLRERIKRNLNVKTAAQQVADVFESLNARPPSVGATLGLLGVHGLSFFFAIVVTLAAVVVHSPQMAQAWRQRDRLQRLGGEGMPVTAASIVPATDTTSHGSAGFGDVPNTLVLGFKTEPEAVAAVGAFAGRSVTRFGQTLFVDYAPADSAAQQTAFARYEKQAADVFVEAGNARASVTLTFTLAQPAGHAAMEELRAYLAHAAWHLSPPWAGDADWPAAERAEADRMRRLMLALQTGPEFDIAAFQARSKTIADAERHGDTAAAERGRAELNAAREQDLKNHAAKLKAEYGHLDFFESWTAVQETKDAKARGEKMKRDLAPHLSVWPTAKPVDLLAKDGYAFDVPTFGTQATCRFEHTPVGLVAMTRWLYAHGATDVRYQIRSGSGATHDDEDEAGL